jgi:hypothetical protein
MHRKNAAGEQPANVVREAWWRWQVKDVIRPSCARLTWCVGLVGLVALPLLDKDVAASGGGAQARPAADSARPVARTPWGDPDLQGIWTNTTSTPFERPAELADRSELTAAEVAKLEEEDRTRLAAASTRSVGGPDHWYELGKRASQTSHVVDPPDGRVPALTAEAQNRRPIGTIQRERFDSLEDLSSWDRCITRGIPGSMLPTFYNNNYQILQVPGYVVILYEMIHDARIIPVDGRPHLRSTMRQWMGDSRGRWEGDTLVVEVTNYTDRTSIHTVRSIAARVAHSHELRLVERFRRVDADTIDYRFTVDDPKTFTRPWTAAIPMTRKGAPDRILEYACHEGNRAIPTILNGSAAQAQEAGTGAGGVRPAR